MPDRRVLHRLLVLEETTTMNRLRNRVCLSGALTVCLATSLGAETFPWGRPRLPLFAVAPIADADQVAFDFTTAPVVVDQVVQKPAGPAPTPRHTGVKAMAKDLVEDVKHLPSKENLFLA